MTLPAGMLDRGALEREIAEGRIDTVVTAIPDLYGRLVGKRIHAPFFASEVLAHGMYVCDHLLACDMEMDPTPGYAFASWATGYGDLHAIPDLATLRRRGVARPLGDRGLRRGAGRAGEGGRRPAQHPAPPARATRTPPGRSSAGSAVAASR